MCIKALWVTLVSLFLFSSFSFAGARHSFIGVEQITDDNSARGAATLLWPGEPQPGTVNASRFRAAILPDAVILSWTFEGTENLKEASLERSANNHDFVTVCSLKKNMRAVTDATTIPGSFYRIKMIAADGAVVYSAILNTGDKATQSATVIR